VLKLAINISLAVQTLALSEGLLLAENAGVDPELALQVMTESPIGSPMLKARAPLFLDPPDDAWFDVDLMQKDIKLALSSGHDLDVPLPSTTVVAELLSAARRHGYERSDITVLFPLLSELSVARASRRLGFAA
jgi:3-hydroxyisobutyrate dehydrogenase-like beta-hydroxyacid dehydrogenase